MWLDELKGDPALEELEHLAKDIGREIVVLGHRKSGKTSLARCLTNGSTLMRSIIHDLKFRSHILGRKKKDKYMKLDFDLFREEFGKLQLQVYDYDVEGFGNFGAWYCDKSVVLLCCDIKQPLWDKVSRTERKQQLSLWLDELAFYHSSSFIIPVLTKVDLLGRDSYSKFKRRDEDKVWFEELLAENATRSNLNIQEMIVCSAYTGEGMGTLLKKIISLLRPEIQEQQQVSGTEKRRCRIM